MPRIPQFKERTVGTPAVRGNLQDARVEQMNAKAVDQLVGEVNRFAQTATQFSAAKTRIEDASLSSEYTRLATLAAHKAKDYAFSNPEGSKNGDTMVPDFESQLEPLKASLTTMSSRRRGIAQNAINKATLKYRLEVETGSRERFLMHQQEVVGESLTDSSLAVSQDPDAFGMLLDEHTKYLNSLELSPDATRKAVEGAESELVLAAVSGFEQRKEFDKAKEFIQSTGNSFLSSDKRIQLLDRIGQKKYQTQTRSQQLEDRRISLLQRKRSQEQDELTANLFTRMVQAETEEEREVILDAALDAVDSLQGSISGYNTLSNLKKKADDGKSVETEFGFTNDITSGRFSQITDRIVDSVGSDELTPQAGAKLLKFAAQERRRLETKPMYKEQRKQANSLLDAAVEPDSFEANMYGMTVPKYSFTKLQQRNQILERASDLQEELNLSPVKAMERAINENLSDVNTGAVVPMIPLHKQSTPQDLINEIQRIRKNFQNLEEPTGEQMKLMEKIERIGMRRVKGLQALEKRNRMFKDTMVVPNE